MAKGKLKINRYLTEAGKAPGDYFEWEKSDVDITDGDNKVIFTQKESEFPERYSQLARQIIASKYFFGEIGTQNRENSLKDLVGRVTTTIEGFSYGDGYFSKEDSKAFQEELTYISYNQMMAFNSPVWFNVGTHNLIEPSSEKKEAWRIAEKDKNIIYETPFGPIEIEIKKGTAIPIEIGEDRLFPQTSACFIQFVEDSMEGIMNLSKKEALLFKYGSGTGSNLSTLRSSYEKLSGGGKPSGPLAYWAFYDKVAGIVKSGGKTRRAARMNCLDDDHPNILEFIDSKMVEEKKLHILIDNGIPFENAQDSVNYQNTNISVRASDKFMNAALNDEEWQTVPVHNKEMADEMPKYKAKDLMRKIAENTHFCGDPGMQFGDTINKWHTCKNSGKINSSNPCSEFMFLDNSACNLASLNLVSFLEGETFDVELFKHVTKLTAISQDLLIDNSSYPTKEIAENSHLFRPLGTGYANLGALVMSQGLPYDSDGARAIAGAITALMTGTVYETSTEMAEKKGTFKEYKKNKEPMMEVMNMHREALKEIDRKKLPKGLENILDEAEKTWDNVIARGEEYGFRNAQATVLAPTGTIGFMMDCDTKGIEPEIGLVQMKKLVGGGILRLVNGTVMPALERLGYDKNQMSEIEKYIEDNATVEGAPHIKEEHIPIFDCSNKPKQGTRTISPLGHLKMMAAVQPFLSGAISKTVNMPEEATVEEIKETYNDAWKMRLKAVAIYRDQSKRSQPLSFAEKENLLEEKVKPVRRKLSNTRDAIVHKFEIAGGHEGYLTVGMYDDGTPGEVFIDMNKEGSTTKGLVDAIGILTSMSLQYGVPLQKIVEKFRHQKFEPYGMVKGHPEIHTTDSTIDYIANFLGKKFLGNGNEENGNGKGNEQPAEIKKEKKQKEEPMEETGGFCIVCGSSMIKKGHCLEKCSKCGWESPKGCGE